MKIRIGFISNSSSSSFIIEADITKKQNYLEINKIYCGDCLDLIKQIKCESIDFIYMDPPYATGRDFNDFLDKFSSLYEYANFFLKPRIIECKRILKKDGNIVIHNEPRISHYIRFVLDDIFGEKRFKNEISWKSGGNKKSQKQLARYHDVLTVYAKSSNSKYFPLYTPYGKDYYKANNVKICPIRKIHYTTSTIHNSQPNVNPRINLRYKWNGHRKQWYVSEKRMQMLHDDNRLVYNKKGIPRIKKYLDEMNGIPIRDLWTDISQIQGSEKMDYATQKPVKLLERLLYLYSQEKDICLDPFAGSGTLGRACINMNRNYILIDINPKGKKLFIKSIK